MTFLSDPRLFNALVTLLFALAAIRWAVEGKWADALYNALAAGITATVTWGFQR